MAIFTEAELADLGELQEESLIDICTIQRPVRTPNGAGGWIVTAGTVASDVPCRVRPMALTRAEALTGMQFNDALPWQIALPVYADIREQDRIVTGGVTYEVLTLWGPGTYKTTTKAICVKR